MINFAAHALFAATVTIDQITLQEQHNQIKWEVLRMLNYCQWVSVSFYALLLANNTELHTQ